MNPFVSVIIPTYNNWKSLRLCLNALTKQTYPQGSFEVIVVNNDPAEICPYELPASNIKLLTEGRKSSYAARNTGIRAAKGSILAFTDADCQPDPAWIENGVRCLHERTICLVGGLINFVFNNPDSASEMLDASTHMDNQRSIQKYEAAVTANLFVKRQVFEAIGLFNENLQSGGDITFTQKAYTCGFKIDYCSKAVVNHPTRNSKEGIKKMFRVASEQGLVIRQMPINHRRKIWLVALHLLPLANPYRVWATIKKYRDGSVLLFVRVMLLSVFMGLLYDAILLKSLFSSIRR